MEKRGWEKLVEKLTKENVLYTPEVIKAMRSVPRSRFLSEDMQTYSTVDTPLPTGFGQTVSAPHSLSNMLG